MPHRIRITPQEAFSELVSLTLRVPEPAERWRLDAGVLVRGYGFRVKNVLSDDGHRLVTLVRDASVDADEEKPDA